MCPICDGKSEDEVREELAAFIDEHGWAVQGVEPGPNSWGWQYTIGLVERFGHPELVVSSTLSRRDELRLLTYLVGEIEQGQRFGPGDRPVVGRAELSFVEVHPQQINNGLLIMWLDHYRAFPELLPSLTALQVVLPPEFFCEHTGPQPRLDRPHDALRRRSGNRAARRAWARDAKGRRRRGPPTRHRR
ncbi:MAG: DUF4262 domain-containing protein [Acidimicrobiales bacterium]